MQVEYRKQGSNLKRVEIYFMTKFTRIKLLHRRVNAVFKKKIADYKFFIYMKLRIGLKSLEKV